MRKYGLQPPPPPPETTAVPVKQTIPSAPATHKAPVIHPAAPLAEEEQLQSVIIKSPEDNVFGKIPKDIVNDKVANIDVYPQYLLNKSNFENFIKYNGITVNKINPLDNSDAGRDALLKLINYIGNIINSIDPRSPTNKNAPGF